MPKTPTDRAPAGQGIIGSMESQIKELQRTLAMARKHRHSLAGGRFYAQQYAERLGEFRQSLRALAQCAENGTDAIDAVKNLETLFRTISRTESPPKEIGRNLCELAKLARSELRFLFADAQAPVSHFSSPAGLPDDVAADIDEAQRAYGAHCYFSAISMARRAYEGMLRRAYSKREGKEPRRIQKCRHCGKDLREAPLSVSELHKWASENGLIRAKLKSNGFDLIGLGAGSAHPTDNFPRDEQTAHLALETLMVLMSDLTRPLDDQAAGQPAQSL